MNPEERLEFLKLELPAAPKVAGLYKPLLIERDLAYFCGHLPILFDGSMIAGKVGAELSIEEGAFAARQVGLNILATLRKELNSLSRVSRVVKLLGMVNATDTFTQHSKVINGCSELLQEVWGNDYGVGVRSALGVAGLPGNAAVEIEGIVKINQ